MVNGYFRLTNWCGRHFFKVTQEAHTQEAQIWNANTDLNANAIRYLLRPTRYALSRSLSHGIRKKIKSIYQLKYKTRRKHFYREDPRTTPVAKLTHKR